MPLRHGHQTLIFILYFMEKEKIFYKYNQILRLKEETPIEQKLFPNNATRLWVPSLVWTNKALSIILNTVSNRGGQVNVGRGSSILIMN